MPEDRRLIPDLTVEENMLLPAWAIGLADAAKRLATVYELDSRSARVRAAQGRCSSPAGSRSSSRWRAR